MNPVLNFRNPAFQKRPVLAKIIGFAVLKLFEVVNSEAANPEMFGIFKNIRPNFCNASLVEFGEFKGVL